MGRLSEIQSVFPLKIRFNAFGTLFEGESGRGKTNGI